MIYLSIISQSIRYSYSYMLPLLTLNLQNRQKGCISCISSQGWYISSCISVLLLYDLVFFFSITAYIKENWGHLFLCSLWLFHEFFSFSKCRWYSVDHIAEWCDLFPCASIENTHSWAWMASSESNTYPCILWAIVSHRLSWFLLCSLFKW